MNNSKLPRVVSPVLFVLALMALGACGLAPDGGSGVEAQVETSVAATVEFDRAVQTAAAQISPPATNTPESSPTPAQSATPTPSPTSDVISIRAEVNTNCRQGPDPVYPVVGYLTVGDPSVVLGQLRVGGWWYIENTTPGRDPCWVWGETTVVEGDPSELPFITPPPTPTPLPNWTGTWSTYIESEGNYTLAIQQSGDNISSTIETFFLFGTLSDYNRSVSGNLIPPTSTPDSVTPAPTPAYVFAWRMLSSGNQFRGYLEYSGTKHAWCGARSGAALPDPCLGP